MGIFLLGRWSPLVFPKEVYLGQSFSLLILTISQPALVRSSMRLFTDDSKVYRIIYVKTTRNNLNVTSTRYTNGVKIGNFVFTLTNVRLYVLPMREIILAILSNSLVVRFMLSPKRLIWGSHCLLIYPGTSKRRKL